VSMGRRMFDNGEEPDVRVAGGADVLQRCLAAGLLDELDLHLAPVFLGGGGRLFDRPKLAGLRLERTGVVASPGVTHLSFHRIFDQQGGVHD
jgi:dihydrofolate reductase